MEETRWWTRLLLVSAIVAVVLLLAGPLGYKFGVSGLQPSLISLLLALVTAIVVFLVSLVMVMVASKSGLVSNRKWLLVTLGIALVPLIVMVPQIHTARSVPPIHDITTDTENPPTFDAVVALRINAMNSLEYGAGMSPTELATLQQQAYPEVVTLSSDLSFDDAVARAVEVLSVQGLEVVNVDPDKGIVEAVATTFWFGFKDDVVVRVTATPQGSLVDLRSVSRVGQSDLGANAARILKFLEAF
ncbi:MAG: DUF1499 domain-containing protein [Pseudomonadales bacterium]